MGIGAVPAVQTENGACPWWETRLCFVLVVVATMLPLVYPPIPPLVDLLGHIGRYRVELDLHRSPFLQQYYDFHWAAMSNLGVDVLILPLAQLLGLELAVKLIVIAIPPLTAIGMLWVAREAHGRVPPTTFFALPFIYGFPFLFGFVNFALSVGLAFLGFGLWLRLGRMNRTGLRASIFAPASLILFYCHAYGLGLLGLMCFSSEAVRLYDRGRPWLRAIFEATLQMSVLALPAAVAMALTARSGNRGEIGLEWFAWGPKWIGFYGNLRDRWGPFDVASVEIAGVIILFALIRPFIYGYPFLFGFVNFTLSVALAFLAFGLWLRLGRCLAVLGLAFFAVRLGATTASFAIAAKDQQAKLGALSSMPRGARVASFYGLPKAEPWSMHRDSHLGGLVIARLEGFSNDQRIDGAYNPLKLKYRAAGGFASNPSEIVRPNGQGDAVYRTIDEALAKVPRDKFDYIWLIEAPPFDKKLIRDLQPVWSGPGTALYRIPH